MKKKLIKLAKLPLPVLCYILAAVIFLLYSAYTLASDGILRATGKIAEQRPEVTDFEFKDLEYENGVLTSTSDDPWLILNNVEGKVRSLRYKAEYSSYPHEINLYYATNKDGVYSQNQRVWPTLTDDGSYKFILPRKNIYSLRLDAASALIEMDFKEIVINERQSALQYFNPGWGGLFMLVFLPPMTAAVLCWLRGMYRHCKRRRAQKEKGV